VVLAALVVIGFGIGLIVYGAKRMFVRRLHTGKMSYSTRRLVVGLGRVGYIAKGVAFGVAGLLAFGAAMTKDAASSTGLDGALHTLAGTPYGQLLLVAVAAGFAAFGVYCFFQSRVPEGVSRCAAPWSSTRRRSSTWTGCVPRSAPPWPTRAGRTRCGTPPTSAARHSGLHRWPTRRFHMMSRPPPSIRWR